MNLRTPISQVPLVGPVYVRRLKALDVNSVEEMLLHIPFRYKDFRKFSDAVRAQIGETVTIQGKVEYIKNIYTSRGKRIQEAEVSDSKGSMKIIWFNQTYLAKTIKTGDRYSFSGKIEEFNRKRA